MSLVQGLLILVMGRGFRFLVVFDLSSLPKLAKEARHRVSWAGSSDGEAPPMVPVEVSKLGQVAWFAGKRKLVGLEDSEGSFVSLLLEIVLVCFCVSVHDGVYDPMYRKHC